MGLFRLLKLAWGKWRVMRGLCPKCALRSPAWEDCPICHYHFNPYDHNSTYGHSQKVLDEWWEKFKKYI